MADSLQLMPIPGIPEVSAGDDLGKLLVAALAQNAITPQENDLLVVAQKVVSKAEGRFVELNSITVSPRASEIARASGKPPQLVQCVLNESTEVLRARAGHLIVRHRTGHVMANAGVDRSNVPQGRDGERVLLLPVDPDASAGRLRQALLAAFGKSVAVIISDSFGRPWRQGVVNFAIGVAGCAPLIDQRSKPDREGRPLQVTQTAFADAVAAAAGLLMGEADEGVPAVLVRGLQPLPASTGVRPLLRPVEQDLFR